MLQQTRVEAVLPRYEAFLRAFPDPAALARAPEETALALWSGLGYYSRARNLRRGAGIVGERYGGRFPADPVEAARLPGVGPYTAAAVLSIVYGQPLAVVDGNVARVLSRLFRLEPPHGTSPARLRALAQALLDPDRPGDHNQAMMELGALVCVPRTPRCGDCPVAESCLARRSGEAAEYPRRRPVPAPEESEPSLLLLRDDRGRLLLERGRWPLLPHLWLPPVRETAAAETGLPPRLRPVPGSLAELGGFSHAITRHRLRFRVHGGLLRPGPGSLPAGFLLLGVDALEGIGRSSILDKALRVEREAGRKRRAGS